jgi:hypothetical protein
LREILDLTGPAVLLPITPDKKKPSFNAWQTTTLADMDRPEHLRKFGPKHNIGVLLGAPSNGLCSIDLDGDEHIEPFLSANPRLRETLRTKRSRGCNLWVRIVGDYPPIKDLVHPQLKNDKGAPLDVGEWRSTGGQTLIAGSVNGVPYRRIVEKPPLEIAFAEIVWPPALIANPPTAAAPAKKPAAAPQSKVLTASDSYPGDGLDLGKLANLKPLAEGAYRAACPACREAGGDFTGEHLHIDSEGKFGCAKHQGDPEHRRAIWRLAGKYDSQVFILPNDHTPISEAARNIFAAIAPTHTLFIRSGTIVELVRRPDGYTLEILREESFRSRLERYGHKLVAWKIDDDGGKVMKPKRCSGDSAKALLATVEAQEFLPPIRTVTNAPVIVPDGDGVKILGPGYHRENGGTLVAGGETPPDMGTDAAAKLLLGLLNEFLFQCPGDKARAFAAMLTPALKIGGFIRGSTPVETREADQPQTGKGFGQKIDRAIYREAAYPIALKAGGVGSLDESICAALLSGKPFIAIDNVRGRLDSQFIEMVLTWGAPVAARVPHKGEILVDPGAATFQLTSNGIEATPDFAKRACITRMLKQPPGHVFTRYPEGNVLDHVIANQPRYLGAVFALIRDWVRRGRPLSEETRHDFREWAGVLDAFTRFHMNEELMAGHEQAQERTANPALSWLRAVGLLVLKAGRGGAELLASDLYDLSADDQLNIPGMRQPDDQQGPQTVGRVLAKCFRESPQVEIDHISITKTALSEYNPDYRRDMVRRTYRFSDLRGATVQPVQPDPITLWKTPPLS